MASIRFDATWLDALDRFVDDLHDHVYSKAQIVSQSIHDDLVRKAQSRPEWAGMSDHMDIWTNPNGTVSFGIRTPDFVSEAFAAEYGDREQPPSPLFRETYANAQSIADEALRLPSERHVPIHAESAVKRNTK